MDEREGQNQKGKPLDAVTVQFTEPSCYLSEKKNLVVAITFTKQKQKFGVPGTINCIEKNDSSVSSPCNLLLQRKLPICTCVARCTQEQT